VTAHPRDRDLEVDPRDVDPDRPQAGPVQPFRRPRVAKNSGSFTFDAIAISAAL